MPMLCIHILRSLIFEAVLLEASKAGQRRVEAGPARQAFVGFFSGYWEVSWVALCSGVSTVLVLRLSGKQDHSV